MRIITFRLGNAGQELLGKSAQISLAIVGGGDTGRGRALDSGQGSLVALNPTDGADEIGQRAGLVKESGALVLDQLGNPGDLRSQHQLFVSHGFHQDHRDSFTLAGHHDQVGVPVIAGKVGAGHLTDQVNTSLESQRCNLTFKIWALGSLADNPAEEVDTLVTKLGAGLDEKAIVLHAMQTSDGEETEPPVILFDAGVEGGGGCGPGKYAIDPQTLHDDFFRGCGGVVAEDVLAVEVGDGYTELASTQLGREQIGALQQIGTVQGEAEADSEQAGSG